MHNTQTDYSKRKQEQYIPASGGSQPLRAAITRKRIGSTTYRVSVHFSDTSTETMNDKIVRLIKSEAAGKAEKGGKGG